MNPELTRLQPYPFEKLSALLKPLSPPAGLPPVDLSIGEPRHPVAPFIREAMSQALDGISRYPTTRGVASLRQACADWTRKRFGLTRLDGETQLLPVNGTREALFSIAHAVIERHPHGEPPLILAPNPFYQIYEGAAITAGAELLPLDCLPENGFLPDIASLPPAVLDRVQLLYLCTPANPTGAVEPLERLKELIRLAHRHDFVIASDECYSEIWYENPPPGILQAAKEMGLESYDRCLAFHSLSKRSNMPGARSGFVAGDAALLARYLQLRTYTGCATPPFVQSTAILAWQDETHVEENRRLYRRKLADALEILQPRLPVTPPQAGFYLWLAVPQGGEAFARRLFERYHVTVLPGGYMGRPSVDPSRPGRNPGDPFVRVAMVSSLEENREGMYRIARCAAEMI
ncbi:MAG: succinyldiaminopimelate transaminase [Magnetococcales bacterium]|nr:succinyldiaminopimelate transaminase [Magnetococcales bacterium]